MPSDCCVVGCTNSSLKDKALGINRSYYGFPGVITNQEKFVEETTERRRREWCKQINRKGFTPSTVRRHHKVCSDHFISGKPSYKLKAEDVDWVPTQKLGHQRVKEPSQRGERLHKRRKLLNDEGAQIHNVACAPADHAECDTELEPRKIKFLLQGKLEMKSLNTASTQTELTGEMIQNTNNELNRLLLENMSLKQKVSEENEDNTFSQASFKDNDEKTRFFTGLPDYLTLLFLFEFLQPHLPGGPRSVLSNFQMLVLTFLRMRFNLPLKLLAYLFKLSRTTAAKYFHLTLDVMYLRMGNMIYWPDRDTLRSAQPTEFKNSFRGRISVIIDCFELFIETPSDLLARAQTFSHYKHHNTAKFLIGITPAGMISYVSKAWGGRTSDKHITEHSNFVNHLLPGDIVLADRGFDINEIIGIMQAEVKIPAFTRGKAQLSAAEIYNTRKIAHLRIHVERVIGTICAKYGILNGTIPLEMLTTRQGENITTLDKLVTVCCACVNTCDSVVATK